MSTPGRTSRRRVDGVLLLDKPAGLSSAAAVARARRAFQAAKTGHTGTLDPLASGLLPLCFGEATKFAGDLLDADKQYLARVQLGTTTSTGDAEGEVLEQRPVAVDDDALERAIAALTGPILQIPPMYSALKREGRPLYSYAREGVVLERPARSITIHELELIARLDDELELRVLCSKGTYVRVLAEDLGALVGCGAHLSGLRRTRVGALELEHAHSLESIEARAPEERDALLAPIDNLVAQCPLMVLDQASVARFVQGQRLPQQGRGPVARLRIYALREPADGGSFLGMAEIDGDGVLHPRRLVAPM